jgi:hypothetical protein
VVRRVECIVDRVSYIVLRGHWCNSTVLNVHASCEDTGDDVKDSLCEEVGHVFYQFPRYSMKILLGDFSAKVGRENIFEPTIGNESLHEHSNDSGFKIVNFAIFKNLVDRVQCAHIPKFINTPGPILRETHTTRLITFDR